MKPATGCCTLWLPDQVVASVGMDLAVHEHYEGREAVMPALHLKGRVAECDIPWILRWEDFRG